MRQIYTVLIYLCASLGKVFIFFLSLQHAANNECPGRRFSTFLAVVGSNTILDIRTLVIASHGNFSAIITSSTGFRGISPHV